MNNFIRSFYYFIIEKEKKIHKKARKQTKQKNKLKSYSYMPNCTENSVPFCWNKNKHSLLGNLLHYLLNVYYVYTYVYVYVYVQKKKDYSSSTYLSCNSYLYIYCILKRTYMLYIYIFHMQYIMKELFVKYILKLFIIWLLKSLSTHYETNYLMLLQKLGHFSNGVYLLL